MVRRLCLMLVVLLSLELRPQAQVITQTALGNASTSCAPITDCAIAQFASYPSITIQLTGTFVGTVAFEGTSDGATWVAVTMTNVGDGTQVTTATAPGQFAIANTGLLAVRARPSAYTSGSIGVVMTRGWTAIALSQNRSVLPVGGCVSWNNDTWLQRSSAGILGISAASCGGANNGTLKANVLTNDGTAAAPSMAFASATDMGVAKVASGRIGISTGGTWRTVIDGASLTIPSDEFFGFASGTDASLASDTKLFRDAANTLALRNGANNQELRVYQNTTGSKYISLSGTGGIQFTGIDNTIDIGASGATRPRTGYFGTSVVVGTSSLSTSVVTAATGWRTTAAAADFYFGNRSGFNAPADGKFLFVNNANTTGVTLDFTTDSTLKLFARDGTSAATLQVGYVEPTGDIHLVNGGSTTFRNAANNANYNLISTSGGSNNVAINDPSGGTTTIRGTGLIAAGTITFAGLASSTGVRYVCANTTGVLDGQAAACVGTEATAQQFLVDGYTLPTTADFLAMKQQIQQLSAELAALRAVAAIR